MPSNAIAKTKSALRYREIVFLTLAIIAVGIAVFVSRAPNARTLEAGTKRFELETAVSDQGRQKGLSGRDFLPGNKGMLFTFRQPEKACFWMKDMNFSLDILWADAQRKVVHIEQNLSPETYPKTFCPTRPAMYVIELPAGSVKQTGIQQGQVLNF